MMLAIDINDVHKIYDGSDKPAVNGLTLHVQQGEIYGILGPNGAGKSTTVMMICGLLQPDRGSIHIFQNDTRTHANIIRHQIGVATQEIALFPALTALENLQYMSRMYGLKNNGARQSMLLERFGLKSKQHVTVKNFSGGMKRRLNLIASILHNPRLLILDEPTAGVDVQSRSIILDFLQEENEKGMTILYSSHIMEEAERLCHRVGIMDDGKMIAQGDLTTLFNRYTGKNLEQIFLEITGKMLRD